MTTQIDRVDSLSQSDWLHEVAALLAKHGAEL